MKEERDYLAEERPPVCVHILGQPLVNELHRLGRLERDRREVMEQALTKACFWLRQNAPGRAFEALEQVLK